MFPLFRRFRFLLIFVLAAVWFAIFQPWGGFPDPDAFYHAKMAALLGQQGPLQTFPWLDLTSLHTHFADQHFLFHLLLVPFVRLFGMLQGNQLASIFFAAAFITTLYIVLDRLRVRHPLAWATLAALSPALILRLSLAKASPLALTWFIIGLAAMALRKPWWGLVAGLGFALSHGGWIVLLGCQFLYFIGETLYDRLVERRAGSVLNATFIFTTLGAVLGTVIHPNFPNNIFFLWVQVVKIGLGTPFGRVFLGSEWLPSTPYGLLSGVALQIIASLIIVAGLTLARREPLDRVQARRVIAFGIPLAALFALTIKSVRYGEYFVPVFVLWLASAWSLVDAQRLWREVRSLRLFQKLGFAAGVLLVTALVIRDLKDPFDTLHREARSFDEFRQPMAVISQLAKPGERVFHSSWDQFPELFVLDDRLRYVAGLDPTFLLEANPELSDLYRDLTFGSVTSTAYEIIHERFGSRFVFLELAGHEGFQKSLQADKRFVLLFKDTHAEVYEVK